MNVAMSFTPRRHSSILKIVPVPMKSERDQILVLARFRHANRYSHRLKTL
jgi:hypothetical protein